MSAEEAELPEVKTLGLLDKMDSKRGSLSSIISTYLAFSAAIEIARRWQSQYMARTSYTVRINGDDPVWNEAHKWLLEQDKNKQTRGYLVKSNGARGQTTFKRARRGWENGQVESQQEEEPLLRVYADDNQSHTVILDGHKVHVSVGREKDEKRDGNRSWFSLIEQMTFTCRTKEARDAVVDLIARLTDSKRQQQKVPYLYTANQWGEWVLRADLGLRSIDTVILPPAQKARILSDLEEFLESEHRYKALGLPYHRGYLFHGPPGTGKTSLAKALADHFKMDIYYIPLSDVKDDTNLLSLVTSVGADSILLLEDIDVLHGAKERDDTEKGISMSGLLNALDGIATPNGLITIMTTNHIEVLDDAVVRPGRVDLLEEIGYLQDDQMPDLTNLMFGVQKRWPSVEAMEITPAQVIEQYKRHLYDSDAAFIAIERFLIRGGKVDV